MTRRALLLWLLLVTVPFLLVEGVLFSWMSASPHPECVDMCGLQQQVSTYLAFVALLVWVAVVLAFLLAWRRLRR